ncbi:MAG TPA: hypothetical protein VHX38_33460 [Pseudonocardiaceae bacterium]|jgi:hypothetical protein|nr:hypothetical protein [Pseudonocardiaceae bacterium]
MRAKSLLVGGAVVVSLGLLAGCGSTVTGSPTAAGASPSGSQGGAGSQLGAQVRTVADLSNLVGDSVQQATTVQVKMVSGASTTSGSIKFGNPVAEQMTVSTGGTTGEQVILLDNNFYIQVPGMSDMSGGKPWMEIKTSDSSNPAAQFFTALVSSIQQSADPANMIKNIEASGTLTKSDSEQLNGEQTTHYSITVNIDKMIANQTNATMKQLLGLAQQKGLTDYPVDVWLNSSGLPVQTTIDMPSINMGAGASGGGLITVTYSNWGAPVTITPPPADQVGSLPTG